MKTKICIIEDDKFIRASFIEVLSLDYEVIGAYSNAEDFLAEVEKLRPEIVLFDIELPGISGIEGIRQLKKKLPKTQVMVVTVYESDTLVFEALCAGAVGYLTKNIEGHRLIDAIEELKRGGAPMSTNIAKMVVSSFQKNNKTPLSKRETEVLALLAQGKSYSVIADEIFLNKETIRSHIKNIYWKLEVHSKADALAVAKKERYIEKI
jgi:DNA-binding NarL/FixJ family response regulator